MNNWDNPRILKLIRLYQERKCLWDSRDSDHYNKELKKEKWNEISEILQVHKNDCERKMNILITQFRREQRRIKDSLNSGFNINNIKQSKWFAYKSLLFLEDKRKVPINEFRMNNNTVFRNTAENCLGKTKIILTKKEIESVNSPEISETKNDDFGNVKKRKKLSVDQSNDATKLQKDEYSAFGEYIGYKIKNFSSNYTRNQVMHIINTILFEAELGKYNQ